MSSCHAVAKLRNDSDPRRRCPRRVRERARGCDLSTSAARARHPRVTWVIGMSGHLLGAVLVADVRVSFPSGECNMLRTLHPVAPNIVIGFAGSVAVGFDLQSRSTSPPNTHTHASMRGATAIPTVTTWPAGSGRGSFSSSARRPRRRRRPSVALRARRPESRRWHCWSTRRHATSSTCTTARPAASPPRRPCCGT